MTELPTPETAPPPRKRLLHPWSGLVILGLDWLFFGSNLLSGGALVFLWSALGLLVGGGAVAWIQKRVQQDSMRLSVIKGLLSGIAVALPFPIAGTALGTFILTLSGLDMLKPSR